MNKARTLDVACLGAGYFSRFHYDAWHRNPATRVIASADSDIEKAKGTGAVRAYATLDSLLQNETPDVLDIITPPHTHLMAIRRALEYKLKLIVCQKPFCASIDEAKQAIALAHAADVLLVVHDNFRFQPWFRVMKNALNNAVLGEVQQLSFRLRTGDGQGAEAYLDRQPYFQSMPRLLMHETGVHYLDTFQYLLGKADSIYADLRTLNPAIQGEDAGLVILGYDDGRRAVLDGNRLLDHDSKNTRLTFGEASLEGTEGEITLKGSGELTLRRFGSHERTVLLKPQSWPGFAGDCVYALQDHIVCSLIHHTALENTAQEYLPVLQQVETVYLSHRKGIVIRC